MKTQTISLVAAAAVLLVGCGKHNGSSGTTTSSASEPGIAESAATATRITGTWKVAHSRTNTDLQNAAYTLKLTMVGGTLTGVISHVSTVKGKSRIYNWPIQDAKLQGDELSFAVSHPFEVGRGEITSSYRGKISGDTIKGTFKESFLGHTYTKYWTAKREGKAHE